MAVDQQMFADKLKRCMGHCLHRATGLVGGRRGSVPTRSRLCWMPLPYGRGSDVRRGADIGRGEDARRGASTGHGADIIGGACRGRGASNLQPSRDGNGAARPADGNRGDMDRGTGSSQRGNSRIYLEADSEVTLA